MEQVDVGFNTKFKKWFLSYFGPTRWQQGINMVNKGNIKLKNVMCKDYAWQDTKEETLSHGRLVFYGGDGEGLDFVKINTKGNGIVADEILVDGSQQQIKFKRFHATDIMIKYNIQEMSWSLFINEKEYPTLHFLGPIDVTFSEKPIRAYIKEADILYSEFMTFFNMSEQLKSAIR